MGYTLCVLGCGTMGVAITSGVLASRHPRNPFHEKWESHTPGTATPKTSADLDPSLPSRFIACVKREESANRLVQVFGAVEGGELVEVWSGKNVQAIQEANVILLCCKPQQSAVILNEPGIKDALEDGSILPPRLSVPCQTPHARFVKA